MLSAGVSHPDLQPVRAEPGAMEIQSYSWERDRLTPPHIVGYKKESPSAPYQPVSLVKIFQYTINVHLIKQILEFNVEDVLLSLSFLLLVR